MPNCRRFFTDGKSITGISKRWRLAGGGWRLSSSSDLHHHDVPIECNELKPLALLQAFLKAEAPSSLSFKILSMERKQGLQTPYTKIDFFHFCGNINLCNLCSTIDR